MRKRAHRRAVGEQMDPCAGLCLTEVLIALAASAIVLSAAFQSLMQFQKRFWIQRTAAAQNEDLRIGREIIESELRAAEPARAVQRAEPELIEFETNLEETETALTESASAMDRSLVVADEVDWPRGKHVRVCWDEDCADSLLARDGRRQRLNLSEPLGKAFPAGSRVRIVNRVRYYLRKNPVGEWRLMRLVDGGANPLIGAVSSFCLRYFTRDGQPARVPGEVARVHVDLAVGQNPVVSWDVSLPDG